MLKHIDGYSAMFTLRSWTHILFSLINTGFVSIPRLEKLQLANKYCLPKSLPFHFLSRLTTT